VTGTGAAGLSLAGWRVLVPRSAERAGGLSDALATAGAIPVPADLISIEQPADTSQLDDALVALQDGRFAWVAFTSVNAVDAVLRRAAALGLDAAIPGATRIAAVGPATATALRDAGLPVDLLPGERGSAVALGAIWPPALDGESVLLPRSDLAAPDLPDALVAKGFRVTAVTTYRTLTGPAPTALAQELADGGFDAVLLTSPSTVTALAGITIAPGTVVGAIGSPTANAATAHGLVPDFTAESPTPAALVEGLVAVAATRRLQER
jgi:uroporphyrinogen-III synthase